MKNSSWIASSNVWKDLNNEGIRDLDLAKNSKSQNNWNVWLWLVVYTLPKTHSSHLQMDGLEYDRFLPIFRGVCC